MAIMRLPVDLRTARAELIVQAMSATSTGRIFLYDGEMPENADTEVTTQVLLASLPLSPVPAVAAAGVITFNPIEEITAIATGTATWARVLDSASGIAFDGDVSDYNGTGLIKMSSTEIVQNAPVKINSGVLTEGNA